MVRCGHGCMVIDGVRYGCMREVAFDASRGQPLVWDTAAVMGEWRLVHRLLSNSSVWDTRIVFVITTQS